MSRGSRALLKEALCVVLCTYAAASGAAQQGSSIVATWRGGSLDRADYESWLKLHELEDGPEAIREMVFVESFAAISRERGAEKDVRTRLEIEAMRQKVLLTALRERVLAEVTIRDEEIEALRLKYPEAFQKPRRLYLRNIFRRLGDDPEATRKRMRELRQELLDKSRTSSKEELSDRFQELAHSESESQSRYRGGHLGFLAAEELPPEVAAAVRGLVPGQLSDVVERGGGLSLFFCEDVREARNPTPDEVRAKLRTNLTRQREKEHWASFEDGLYRAAAPRLQPPAKGAAPETTVLEMEGYRLSAGELAELLDLRSAKSPSPQHLDELAPNQVEELLRSWAARVLGVRRAVELGLEEIPENAAALRWGRLGVLAHRELVRRIDERLKEPGEKEVKTRIEANPRRYREPPASELAVIFFGPADKPDPQQFSQAADVARRLEAGELTFEEAARRYSVHPSSAEGGRIGWKNQHQIATWGPTVVQALRQMSPGERTGLLSLDSGLWIFELRARRDSTPMTPEAAREMARYDLQRQQIQELERTIRQEHLASLGLTMPATPPKP